MLTIQNIILVEILQHHNQNSKGVQNSCSDNESVDTVDPKEQKKHFVHFLVSESHGEKKNSHICLKS